jgi:hypothetical protein
MHIKTDSSISTKKIVEKFAFTKTFVYVCITKRFVYLV